jgi:hypothetical protein
VYDRPFEHVKYVKLIGEITHLSFRVHFNNVISAVNQRFYLMKLLCALGLNDFDLSVVFNALMSPKILFASQAFTGQLHVDELDSLQRCLIQAFEWGFTPIKHDIMELFELTDYKLFKILSL